MEPYVTYAGRDQPEPGKWRVRFDLHTSGDFAGEFYWAGFDNRADMYDVDAPGFWGSAAYLGGHFIENSQVFDAATGELNLTAGAVAEHARSAHPPLREPAVGAVCWRFGSPPQGTQPTDHHWTA